MGLYLEATSGINQNKNKNKNKARIIASRMLCTNNAAESPFGTAKAYLDQYPSMKLSRPWRLLRDQYVVGPIVLNTHGIGKHAKEAGIAVTAPEPVKAAVSKLCGVRRGSPARGTDSPDANEQRRRRGRGEPGAEKSKGKTNGGQGERPAQENEQN